MKKETIEKHGVEQGLEGARLKRFVHFFSKRFPDESETISSYVREWANRFKAPNDPTACMDSQSQEVYFSYFETEE